MINWRPIDSAPRDNPRLLLRCRAYGGTKIVEGGWRDSGFDKFRWMPWSGSLKITSTETLDPEAWSNES